MVRGCAYNPNCSNGAPPWDRHIYIYVYMTILQTVPPCHRYINKIEVQKCWQPSLPLPVTRIARRNTGRPIKHGVYLEETGVFSCSCVQLSGYKGRGISESSKSEAQPARRTGVASATRKPSRYSFPCLFISFLLHFLFSRVGSL